MKFIELYNIINYIIDIIAYADDTTIITETKEQMHKAIARIVEYCIKFDIIINEAKTQWMKIGESVRETSEGVPIVVAAEEGENF